MKSCNHTIGSFYDNGLKTLRFVTISQVRNNPYIISMVQDRFYFCPHKSCGEKLHWDDVDKAIEELKKVL